MFLVLVFSIQFASVLFSLIFQKKRNQGNRQIRQFWENRDLGECFATISENWFRVPKAQRHLENICSQRKKIPSQDLHHHRFSFEIRGPQFVAFYRHISQSDETIRNVFQRNITVWGNRSKSDDDTKKLTEVDTASQYFSYHTFQPMGMREMSNAFGSCIVWLHNDVKGPMVDYLLLPRDQKILLE